MCERCVYRDLSEIITNKIMFNAFPFLGIWNLLKPDRLPPTLPLHQFLPKLQLFKLKLLDSAENLAIAPTPLLKTHVTAPEFTISLAREYDVE